MPEIAKKYLENLKITMASSFRIAKQNRNTRMELEQINHNRIIKKIEN